MIKEKEVFVIMQDSQDEYSDTSWPIAVADTEQQAEEIASNTGGWVHYASVPHYT